MLQTRTNWAYLPAFFLAMNLLYASTLETSAAEFKWSTNDKDGVADLYFDGKPVLRYMYAFDTSTKERALETYKVFHHVFGPESGDQITKGAGGKFTHHRGLYVGWNKTKIEGGPTYDFWHCKGGAALKHVDFESMDASEESATMTALIHWIDPEGKPVIEEHRTVSVSRETNTTGWQIDWRTKLESKRGKVSLSGDRQHAGFQFRADQPVADSNGASFLRPLNFPQAREAIQVGDKGDPPPHINLSWFAETFKLRGHQYTVEYFDNPNLPKPALFSERPYGRFGTYFSTTIDTDNPLEMVYRIVVSEGEIPEPQAIQVRYEAFVSGL